MVNRVTLIGNLGQDPELKSTTGGTAVATLSVATSRSVKKNDAWEDVTEWHRVKVWGKQAESVAKYCKKGKQLYVEGRLETSKWQDKDGKDRYTTEVVAEVVKFLGGHSDGGGNQGGYGGGRSSGGGGYGGSAPSGGGSGGGYGGGGSAPDDDGIPFAKVIP